MTRRARREATTVRVKQRRRRAGATPVGQHPHPLSVHERWGLCVALIAVTVLVYAPVRTYSFIMIDDPFYVYENLNVTGGLTLDSIRWAITTGFFANWHPLTWISHMMDVELFGVNAGGHHVVNAVFHVANTLLLFWLLFRMTGAAGRSAFVAALFAVHPMHVESVAWVSERKDVLSTFFGLLTMIAYAAWVRGPGIRRYLAVMGLFALGLMAKPMLVTLPFVLILLDVWPLRRVSYPGDPPRAWLRLAYEKIPLFAMCAASSVVTFFVQRGSGAVESLERLSLSVRVSHALVAYARYVRKLVLPYDLAIPYPYERDIPAAAVLASLLLIVGVSAFAVRALRTHPYVAVGWFWFLGMLVPVIGLVQVGTQDMADRYSYVPAVGLFLILAWGAVDALGKKAVPRPVLAGLALLVTGASALAARKQVEHWESSVTLLRHTVAVTEGNSQAHSMLGWQLGKDGRLDEGARHLEEAIRLDPSYLPAYTNFAEVLVDHGRLEEALPHYHEALRLVPGHTIVHTQLAIAYARLGRTEEAISHYEDALRLEPRYADAHNGIALVLARQGRVAEAIDHYREAIEINPTYAEAHNNLGVAFAGLTQVDSAIAHFSDAARVKADYAEAHNNLGIALGTQGKVAEAEAAFGEAVRINPGYAQAYYGLGALLEREGRLAEAAGALESALRIDPGYQAARQLLDAVERRRE